MVQQSLIVHGHFVFDSTLVLLKLLALYHSCATFSVAVCTFAQNCICGFFVLCILPFYYFIFAPFLYFVFVLFCIFWHQNVICYSHGTKIQDRERNGCFFSLPKTRIVGKYIYVHFIRERCILFWPCYIQELRIPNHLADSLGDLIDHIGYLPTSLLLQIALLASSIVLSWYHHQSESHQQGLVCTWIGPIDQYNRPDPRTPGSNKNYHEIFISV